MKNFTSRIIIVALMVLLIVPASAAEDIFEPIKKGDLDKIKAILESDPSLLNVREANDRTPLMQALFSRQVAVFKFLLEKGADFNAANKDGFTTSFCRFFQRKGAG